MPKLPDCLTFEVSDFSISMKLDENLDVSCKKLLHQIDLWVVVAHTFNLSIQQTQIHPDLYEFKDSSQWKQPGMVTNAFNPRSDGRKQK
ncbi:hypothetical protein STEG23_017839, partial [Scotinomys teguina]